MTGNLKFFLIIAVGIIFSSGFFFKAEAKPGVKKAAWGKTSAGAAVEIYTLNNSKGAQARIITYGGTVVSLRRPDKNGKFADVVLGYDSIADYEKNRSYLGALIGRYANRIAKGRFSLNGKELVLAKNNGENHLTGGSIATGELRSVKAAPFDLLTSTASGARIDTADEQLKFGNGYDHNWVLNKRDRSLTLAANVFEPSSGRNYPRRSGFCLAAQNFHDAPNRPDFPPSNLKPEAAYAQPTVFKFSVS